MILTTSPYSYPCVFPSHTVSGLVHTDNRIWPKGNMLHLRLGDERLRFSSQDSLSTSIFVSIVPTLLFIVVREASCHRGRALRQPYGEIGFIWWGIKSCQPPESLKADLTALVEHLNDCELIQPHEELPDSEPLAKVRSWVK